MQKFHILNLLRHSHLTLIVNRVHNDDIHTYDEVTRALTVIGCDSPLIQTQEIDQKGETVVASCDIEKCRAVCVRLRHEGLLVTTCRAGKVDIINVSPSNMLVGGNYTRMF